MKKKQKKKASSKSVNLNKPFSTKLCLDEKDIARETIPYLNHRLTIDDKAEENQ